MAPFKSALVILHKICFAGPSEAVKQVRVKLTPPRAVEGKTPPVRDRVNYEDWIKLLDDDVDVRKPKTMRKIKPETYEVDDHNNGDLIWDHSPQNVNSEADYNWSDALTPRNPADFVRLFTDELIEEAIERDETIVTDSGTDDDDFPNDKDELQTTRRLLSSTSANFLDPEFPVRTPLLPETVNLERVQNLNPALELATALLPDLVDPN